MDTNAESSMRNKIAEYVKQYALITLSISIMSVGVYFFKFPNNFVFGGVTGMAALAAKLTPLSASAFSSAANMILLGVVFSHSMGFFDTFNKVFTDKTISAYSQRDRKSVV